MEVFRLVDGTRICRHTCDYGEHFVYSSSPEPNGLPYEVLDYIAPNEDLPKIPYLLWLKAVKFFYDYAKQSKEVHVRFWYNPATNVWLCTVPKQQITAVSVDFDFSVNVCIETGETYTIPSKEMAQYVLLWQVHSHHSMNPTPSCVDDEGNKLAKDGELYRPGGYGIVGNMRGTTYDVGFTVVSLVDDAAKYKNKRYKIPAEKVVDTRNGYPDVTEQNNTVYSIPYSEKVKVVISNRVLPVSRLAGTKPQQAYDISTWNTFIGGGKYYLAEIPDIVSQLSAEELLKELVLKHGEFEIKSLLNKIGGDCA